MLIQVQEKFGVFKKIPRILKNTKALLRAHLIVEARAGTWDRLGVGHQFDGTRAWKATERFAVPYHAVHKGEEVVLVGQMANFFPFSDFPFSKFWGGNETLNP